jgi:hypothetical protein
MVPPSPGLTDTVSNCHALFWIHGPSSAVAKVHALERERHWRQCDCSNQTRGDFYV